ncbi:hypothetical protein K458DRAFT_407653 [Lentithecium fluviatile CBS 122367]|uniref:Uncharacterized protein n=1 Tax=Lentithecium fluviatile CBS 122367 TaxID=1168545 RepID=A0A6G1IQ13_9PLEO|nr:hypothetical protein K458DRAFT_407653 [Lentithecium fluviatile CBS 122367]
MATKGLLEQLKIRKELKRLLISQAQVHFGPWPCIENSDECEDVVSAMISLLDDLERNPGGACGYLLCEKGNITLKFIIDVRSSVTVDSNGARGEMRLANSNPIQEQALPNANTVDSQHVMTRVGQIESHGYVQDANSSSFLTNKGEIVCQDAYIVIQNDENGASDHCISTEDLDIVTGTFPEGSVVCVNDVDGDAYLLTIFAPATSIYEADMPIGGVTMISLFVRAVLSVHGAFNHLTFT